MKTTLAIQNLKCNGCSSTIIKRLSALNSIENVTINKENSSVTFSYNNETTLETAKNQLKILGYPVLGEKNAISTKAKSFVSCAIGRINS
ncbi:MAG: heavy-metal-associated domain-containing protein [Jejuia sp.]